MLYDNLNQAALEAAKTLEIAKSLGELAANLSEELADNYADYHDDESIAFCTHCGHDLSIGSMTTCRCSVDHWEISPVGIDDSPMMLCTFPGGVVQLSLSEDVVLCTNEDREWFLYEV